MRHTTFLFEQLNMMWRQSGTQAYQTQILKQGAGESQRDETDGRIKRYQTNDSPRLAITLSLTRRRGVRRRREVLA